MPETVTPTIGRIVHYVLSTHDPVFPHKVGLHRTAVVVNTWPGSSAIQLHVLLDGRNDSDDGKLVMWKARVSPDPTMEIDPLPSVCGTWHWPERSE